MRSHMNHQFSMVPSAEIQRSSFDRSHCHKTTFNAGSLIPVYVDEALPGDTFNLRMNAFARMTTPIKPIMDNLFMDSFFFAVPDRLIWSHWVNFNGEQTNPGDSTSYVIPQMTAPNHAAGGIAVGSLSDYFGLPTGPLDTSNTGIKFNSLWHRAYNFIWNQWFRDENLQNSVTVDTGDGPDTYANYVLKSRGKRHDYFTSCLPWPQKGTAVTIPLGTSAPVKGMGAQTLVYQSGSQAVHETGGIDTTYTSFKKIDPSSADSTFYVKADPAHPSYPDIYADLTNATSATINSLRQAFQLQRMYERDARGGTRYTEIVRSHFGVISPDARLQRPEYLGGGSTPINVHPIAQTAPTVGGQTPIGNTSAFATAAIGGHGFTKSFTEHCVIIGLVSVRADLTYQQGMNRMFSRQTRFDFYWPALAHLGEQTVLNQEIYADGSTNDANVFGYQERYAEYRYKPSLITGQFRSTYATPLDVWHLAQDFLSLPTLGDTFITENPPISRVVAVTSEPQFYFDSFFDLKCARPMPVYGVPGLIDHF